MAFVLYIIVAYIYIYLYVYIYLFVLVEAKLYLLSTYLVVHPPSIQRKSDTPGPSWASGCGRLLERDSDLHIPPASAKRHPCGRWAIFWGAGPKFKGPKTGPLKLRWLFFKTKTWEFPFFGSRLFLGFILPKVVDLKMPGWSWEYILSQLNLQTEGQGVNEHCIWLQLVFQH